jgi:hypothetical protein
MVSLRWREDKQDRADVAARNSVDFQTTFVSEGRLQYAVEKGENSSEPSYQEVSGAPVETRSPLGSVLSD